MSDTVHEKLDAVDVDGAAKLEREIIDFVCTKDPEPGTDVLFNALASALASAISCLADDPLRAADQAGDLIREIVELNLERPPIH
jgi:hypothetical protein